MLEKIKANSKLAAIIGAIGAVLIIAVAAIFINVTNHGGKAVINYSDENRSAVIELGEDDTTNPDSEFYGRGEAGDEVEVDIPTVETVDAGQRVESEEYTQEQLDEINARLNDGEEVGLGSTIDLSFLDISSPSAVKNSFLYRCVNTDFAFGAQCYDEFDAFVQKLANRRATTCGTGAAKGMIADGCWQKNAGSEFTMIWNWKDTQPGDWLVFRGGDWGHVGMAVGYPNGNYIVLLGQNQGGAACPGGGAAGSLINKGNSDFIGAFRPKIYIKNPAPTPTPTPEPTPSTTAYTVKKGDTLGAIARKFCGYDGKKLFGNDGYAQKMAEASGIKSRTYIYPKQLIYCPSFK